MLSIETSNSLETSVEVQEGMEIDRGYISPQFITNNVRRKINFCQCLDQCLVGEWHAKLFFRRRDRSSWAHCKRPSV